MEVYSETYESAMRIPVPFRKWLIRRWNKRRDEEKNNQTPGSDTSQPLSPAERLNMIKRNQQATPAQVSENISPSDFLGRRRNKSE